MYSRFASNFYRNGLEKGFQLMGADASAPSEATYFHMQKVERATTFIYITVCDTTRADWQALLAKDAERRAQVQGLLNQVQNVALLYLMAEPTAAIDPAAIPAALIEPYEGQPVYSVFWRINLENGEITTAPDQPKELFGLGDMTRKAYAQAKAAESGFDAVSAAQSLLGGGHSPHPNIVPMKKTPPRTKTHAHSFLTRIRFLNLNLYPKYHHAYIVYGIIAINLLVLVAMHVAGNPMSPYTAYRFGGNFYASVVYGGQWWRLVTSTFVHYGVMHFMANTVGLVIIGTRVERYLGRAMFATIYLFSGITGSLLCLLNVHLRDLFIVSAGASGAVYGLMGAVLVITRLTRRNIENLNWQILLVWLIIGVVMGFTLANINNAAHLGGFLGGALVGFGMLAVMAYKK
ncbi:MAG: rhomboid family intramembrane serine protease [Defluviitaleaceae bacterium]|nr:rhomboid family intramembrane serine protease [Defluviitaleaceae bacterium]MCL2239794.1 rhomboid family intramembrane serine protease [Defluviitaleaceae bacterium]